MEAASIKVKPTFILTTKLVLDLMFKRIFWCTDLLLGLIFFNETPVMQNREREAIISEMYVRIICFNLKILIKTKINPFWIRSEQSSGEIRQYYKIQAGAFFKVACTRLLLHSMWLIASSISMLVLIIANNKASINLWQASKENAFNSTI